MRCNAAMRCCRARCSRPAARRSADIVHGKPRARVHRARRQWRRSPLGRACRNDDACVHDAAGRQLVHFCRAIELRHHRSRGRVAAVPALERDGLVFRCAQILPCHCARAPPQRSQASPASASSHCTARARSASYFTQRLPMATRIQECKRCWPAPAGSAQTCSCGAALSCGRLRRRPAPTPASWRRRNTRSTTPWTTHATVRKREVPRKRFSLRTQFQAKCIHDHHARAADLTTESDVDVSLPDVPTRITSRQGRGRRRPPRRRRERRVR